MRIRRPSRRNAHTFLIHVFGQGLDGERYVVERYRSLASGEIRPVQAEEAKPGGRRKHRRTIASASEVNKLQPERDEVIVCTALDLKGSGVQIWGIRASGLAAMRYAR